MSAVVRQPGGTTLSLDQAKTLTDEIRTDYKSICMRLLRAFEGNAHGALGYSSWADYCNAEFDYGRDKAYRLVNAARVIELIEDDDPQSPIGDSGIRSESVAREFTPLLDDPAKVREAHAEAIATAPRDENGRPVVTAGHTRTVVAKHKKPPPNPPGQTMRPGGSAPLKTIGINDAVTSLARAINGDSEAAIDALAVLQKSAAGGLYGPQTKDANKAFTDLVDVVALLLERQS